MRLSRLVSAAGLAITLTMGAPPSRAADDAAALVTQFCDRTLRIISDPRIAAADRERRLHALVDEAFDFPAIARYVLGRYWPTASEGERAQFTAAFEDHMVRSYVVRFSGYGGEKLRVLAARPEGDGVTIVPVEILRPNGQPPVVLNWQVQRAPAGWRIRDVSISGVSMAVTYRDEFASVVQRSNGKVAVLIAALRAKSGDE
jgi:phospholipid transport system substrate-binding protein